MSKALLLFVLGGSCVLAQTYKCDWAVVGQGGGDMNSSAYRCGATAGQTAAGQTASGSYLAFIGYWQSDLQVGMAEERSTPYALRYTLEARPNPFSGAVAIRYSLVSDGPVSLVVHDITGSIVREFTASSMKRGAHSFAWDGRDERGQRLANGVYFCRLVAGDDRQTEKLVLER